MALEITLADGAAGERAGLYYALGELYLRGAGAGRASSGHLETHAQPLLALPSHLF